MSDSVRRSILWQGDLAGNWSFPITNRALAGAMVRRGWNVFACYPCSGENAEELRALGVRPFNGEPYLVGVRKTYPKDYNRISGAVKVGLGGSPATEVAESHVKAARCADLIGCMSEWARQNLVRAGVEKSPVVIGNGINPDDCRPEDGKVNPKPRILYVGAATERKGWPAVRQAFAALAAARENVEIWAVCPGAKKDEIPGARIVGESIPNAAVLSLCKSADLLVCASALETHCRPAVEALACGVPVVVPDWGPYREICAGPGAWLYPVSRSRIPKGNRECETEGWAGEWYVADSQVLVGSIRRALSNLAELTVEARERSYTVRRELSWDSVASRLSRHLKGVCHVS